MSIRTCFWGVTSARLLRLTAESSG
jgi:hypothetical protein